MWKPMTRSATIDALWGVSCSSSAERMCAARHQGRNSGYRSTAATSSKSCAGAEGRKRCSVDFDMVLSYAVMNVVGYAKRHLFCVAANNVFLLLLAPHG